MRALLYPANEERFDTYGLGYIETLARNVERERNGIPKLYMELDAFNPMNAILKEGMRVKADAGKRTPNQTFVIERVVKNSNGITQVYANHIAHTLTKTALKPKLKSTPVPAPNALETWRQGLVGDKQWEVGTDILTQGAFEWTIDKQTNAFSALVGVEGSIIDVFGGELEFDNRRIYLHKQMGRDTPTVLEYGRNIITAEQDAELTNVYTSVYPYAITTTESKQDKDGTYTPGDTVIHTIKDYVIDGPHRNKYPQQRILPVNFSDKFDDKNPPTEAGLKKLAEQYIKANQIGVPNVNIKVEYADLSSMLDYSTDELARIMEEVELCDIVPVYFGALGIETKAKVVKTVYDFELEEYTSVEIGHSSLGVRSAVEGIIGGQIKALEATQKTLASDLGAFVLTNSGNRVWNEQPANVEHKVGDVWFQKNGPYKRMYIWNGTTWELQFDSEDTASIRTQLTEAQKDTEALKEQVKAFKVPESMTLEQMADYIQRLNEQQRTTIKAIGNDASTIYTENRIQEEVVTKNPVTITLEEGKLVIRHNGSGFTAGEDYNLSFTMEEVERPHHPNGVTVRNKQLVPFTVTMVPNNRHYLTKAGEAREAKGTVKLDKVYYDTYTVTMRAEGYLPAVFTVKVGRDQQPDYTFSLTEVADYLESAIYGTVNMLAVECEPVSAFIVLDNYTEEWEHVSL